jgi:hypothetical protein
MVFRRELPTKSTGQPFNIPYLLFHTYYEHEERKGEKRGFWGMGYGRSHNVRKEGTLV